MAISAIKFAATIVIAKNISEIQVNNFIRE
jgi:hypothetical protein